jgi:hypothetical protein
MGRSRKPPHERSRKVSVSLTDGVLYALERAAQEGRRSLSSTIELYIRSDVGLAPLLRPGHEVGPEQADATDRLMPGVDVEGLRGPRVAPPPDRRASTRGTPGQARPARSGLCPHRIPSGSHCRVCDR